jgi:NADH:ubiquinone reductase (H+-translocating)
MILPDARSRWHGLAQLPEKLGRSGIAASHLHLVIVGSGATGVELAAELSHYIETLSRYATDEMPTHLRMTLIETAPGLPQRISKSVEAKLRQLGIDVRTNTKVVGADAKGVILDGGQRVEAALVVGAAGVKAPDVVSKLDGLEVNHRGQIMVRPTLQSKEDDSVFALGDCSSFSGVDGRSATRA